MLSPFQESLSSVVTFLHSLSLLWRCALMLSIAGLAAWWGSPLILRGIHRLMHGVVWAFEGLTALVLWPFSRLEERYRQRGAPFPSSLERIESAAQGGVRVAAHGVTYLERRMEQWRERPQGRVAAAGCLAVPLLLVALAAEPTAEQRAQQQHALQIQREAAERARRELQEQAQRAALEQARRELQEQTQRAALEQARREAAEQAQRAMFEQARREAAEQTQQVALEQARREAAEQAQRAALEQARREALEQAQRETLERLRQETAAQAQRATLEQTRRAALERSQREALERSQREAAERLQRARAEQEARERSQRPPASSVPSVGSPQTKVGDTYVVEYSNPDNPKATYSVERKVIAVGNGAITVAAKTVNSKTGKVRTLLFTPAWNLISTRNADGTGFDYSPPLKYFDFPLHPGKTWQQTSRETNVQTGATREHTISATVGEWEDVVGPTGKWRSIKITLNTTLLDNTTGNKSPGVDVSWYVPEIRRTIKSDTTSRNLQGQEERQVIQVLRHDLQ